ncbi:MarR family winged helix-turn-helix transcriptional regulator [Nocardia carnea]|uniref:MarR family winged helix-turn-helix transcriptional regulator n=1 Tax=Nocardia carnea TaxID=37328 RepID=UPI002456C90D|nr:MarR family transcriptional regulator [Nocardia carnea]
MAEDEATGAMALAMAVRELVHAVDTYRGVRAEAAGGVAVIDIVTLGHLLVQGPRTPTELAHTLGVTTASTTDLLDRLQRRDWIVREPHPHDRRRILIQLTDIGRGVISETYREFAALLEPAYSELGPEHRLVVMEFLQAATLRLVHEPRDTAAGPARDRQSPARHNSRGTRRANIAAQDRST